MRRLRHIARYVGLGVSTALGCHSGVIDEELDRRVAEARSQAQRQALESAAPCPPAVHITVPYPGASIDEVEHRVTVVLEDAVASLAGLRRLESRSQEGKAQLRLEFSNPADLAPVRAELESRIADALPPDAEAPTVIFDELDSRPPQTLLRVHGNGSEVAGVLEQLRSQGLDANLVGGRQRRLLVSLDPRRMAEFGLSAPQLRAALVAGIPIEPHVLTPAYDPIRSLTEIDLGTPDAPVRLGDIATIELDTASTPLVLGPSAEVGLVVVTGQFSARATDVRSRFPQDMLGSGQPMRAPRCHRESLEGLEAVVAIRVHSSVPDGPTPDLASVARRLLAELAPLDPDLLALVGVSEGLGLDLSSAGADLHLLVADASSSSVLQRLQRRPDLEPVRVWGAPRTRVAVLGSEIEARDRATEALRDTLREAGFDALAPQPRTAPQLSFSLLPAAHELGLTASDLANQIRATLAAEPLALLSIDDTVLPLVLDISSTESRSETSDLADVQIETPRGTRVSLSAVATVERFRPAAERRRVDQQPARELETGAPKAAVIAAWAKLVTAHPGVEMLVD